MLEINIREIATSLGIKNIAFTSPQNKRVGNAPILDNGLNLIYAPQGYGKSYTSISIAKETRLPSVYFDLESNGSSFVDYCEKNQVYYVYLGDSSKPLEDIKSITNEINIKYGKAFVIIDSYSDLFPHDEGKMAKEAQQALGALNKFFMRTAKMPVLLLDHATEVEGSYKIEGNKSGKFKKTLVVLRLDKIDKNIDNGTHITIERSRDHDALKVGHRQVYSRNNYLKDKLMKLIEEQRLSTEFTAKDLESCTTGNDRTLWRSIQNEIATSRKEKESRKTLWTLKRESDIGGRESLPSQ